MGTLFITDAEAKIAALATSAIEALAKVAPMSTVPDGSACAARTLGMVFQEVMERADPIDRTVRGPLATYSDLGINSSTTVGSFRLWGPERPRKAAKPRRKRKAVF